MEVQWCSDHGLPHSSLLSWDDQDRAKLVAFLLESSSRCSMCGTAEWEWNEDKYAYEPINKQCWGCYRKEMAREESDTLPGSTITLVPKHHAEHLRMQQEQASID
ncbi:hypothetical protein UFOVP1264_2 [uncultured Caudovirales phage]|uniref:Uncharacterized protein n=1 Tax=uncultured Caudovirales phage TaxID=2100421 RepID=A0A6J5RK20_9CAUD|nr:hypothetical protein UFOVP1264_2 [uncultured Caudovirales phage]